MEFVSVEALCEALALLLLVKLGVTLVVDVVVDDDDEDAGAVEVLFRKTGVADERSDGNAVSSWSASASFSFVVKAPSSSSSSSSEMASSYCSMSVCVFLALRWPVVVSPISFLRVSKWAWLGPIDCVFHAGCCDGKSAACFGAAAAGGFGIAMEDLRELRGGGRPYVREEVCVVEEVAGGGTRDRCLPACISSFVKLSLSSPNSWRYMQSGLVHGRLRKK